MRIRQGLHHRPCQTETLGESVIWAIKVLAIEDALNEKRDKLLRYYTTNLERMEYRKFR